MCVDKIKKQIVCHENLCVIILIMNKLIKKALQFEKSGEYDKALKMYMELENQSLSQEDRLFISRSIAACFYYRHDYKEARKRFDSILKDKSLKADVVKEINNCIALCFLYGGETDKARNFFLSEIRDTE